MLCRVGIGAYVATGVDGDAELAADGDELKVLIVVLVIVLDSNLKVLRGRNSVPLLESGRGCAQLFERSTSAGEGDDLDAGRW